MRRLLAGLFTGAIAASAPFVPSLIGCADPGREALDRARHGVETLIAIAEKRSRGELSGTRLTAALRTFSEGEGAEIETLSEDTARALGRASRQALSERWRVASEALSRRLGALRAANDRLR